MADVSPQFPPGTRLGDGGRYELRRRVGVGGMAEVYKATDTRLGGRVVAIKTLSTNIAVHPCGEKIRALFIQEAQALSRVNDENVVDVLDFGVTDGKTPYMVMEFLQGEDLGAFLKRTQPMAIEDAVDVMLGVCAGIHACHMAGIIHRDLKPANIFLAQTPKGRQPKVLDFSVAKVLPPEDDRADKTSTDLIVGTPSYMSPEQAQGQPADELSDQYSIGALLYRSLTGRPPRGIPAKPRELRPDIPLDLEEAILRAIDSTPANRFATVHELGRQLLPHTSAVRRGHWNSYYQAPPTRLAPNLSGSIVVHRGGEQAQGPVTSTTAAGLYDFGVHDRTTRAEAARPLGADEVTGSTVRDPVPADGLTASGTVLSPNTVEIVLPPEVPNAEALPKHAAEPLPVAHTRTRIIVAFVSAATLIVAITARGAIHLRGRSAPAGPPGLPDVLKSRAVNPGVPTSSNPAPQAPTRTADPVPVVSATPVADPPPIPPASRIRAATPHRSRHVTHSNPAPNHQPPVLYGPDGMPIVN